MTFFLSTMSLGGLVFILYSIVIGVILYVITDKYNYMTNVVIYAIVRTILPIILMSPKNFGTIMLLLLTYAISGLVVVAVGQKIRENFDYDTILYYIFIVAVIEIVMILITRGLLSLFA